ncbi:hypothetical protein LG329_19420 (plasmid) [Virgibacillus necropolis]|uniref:hypothetical protein n=1 Tax=Virgibacillus necropolis TaxID=163877 RepID=UPI00384C3679
MKKFMPGHLSNFGDAQKMLEYDQDYFANGAMTEIKEDYHSEWEIEFQEEIIKKILAEDD